jgi:hypothetical protein
VGPWEHRSDSLAGAFNNPVKGPELTRRDENLYRHKACARCCDAGQLYENGAPSRATNRR